MFSALTSTLYALWRDLSTDPFSPYLPQGYTSTARLPSYPTSSPITMEFTPSPYDVQRTRLLLHRGIGVPVEIADLIIDAAQYWPAATGTTTAVGPAVLHPAGPGRGRQGEVLARRSRSAIVRASDTGRNKAAQLVVVTGAVPGDGSLGGRGRGWEGLRKVKVRSMKWWLKSRDQGWVSEGSATTGTYFGSSSWFDACILRPLSPSDPRPPITPETAARIEKLIQRSGPPSSSETFPTFLVGNLLSNDPEDARSLFRSLGWDFVERVERVEVDGEVGERRGLVWKLQSNLVACKEYLVHGGEWRRTGEQGEGEQEGDRGSGDGLGFMDLMKAGDRVVIWARAMFPGWVNDVEDVKVEIRYSV